MIEIIRSDRIGEVIYVNSRRYRDDEHAVRYPPYRPRPDDAHSRRRPCPVDYGSGLARRSGGPGYRSMTAVSANQASPESPATCARPGFSQAEDLPPDRVEVVGDLGSVELFVGHTLHVYAEGRLMTYPAAEADDPLRNEQDHFLACVRDRSRTPALNLEQALAGLRLADAAIESLRLGREVILPP